MLKLSVIIPVYNVVKYLRECLDSVLNQDFSDYEVICVDDGSTDGSIDILKEYESKYKQLRLIRHEKNKGQSAARNTGMKFAQGRYIQFIDSDDMIKRGTFMLLYSYAEEKQADVVYFNMEFLNDETRHLVRNKEKSKHFDGVKTGRELFCLYQQAGTPKVEPVRQMIRRSFLIESQIVFYEGIIHEDQLFSFQVAMEAKRAVDLDAELYIYRQRYDSTMWSCKNKSAASLFICFINMCSYWVTHHFSESENQWIAFYLKKMYEYYTYHRCYQYKDEPIGGYKEQEIYNMLFGERSMEITLDEGDIATLRKSRINILYGAGKIAADVFEILKKYNIQINHVAVSDTKGNAEMMNGLAVEKISNLLDFRDGIVILGTEEKWHEEIIETLERYGFNNYVKPQRIKSGREYNEL